MKASDKLKEECAVFGTSLTQAEAVGITYNGLLTLQHRGQEGAGIAVVFDGGIFCHKSMGLVTDVFAKNSFSGLPQSSVAIGHTRYSTTGGNVQENTGPFVAEYLLGRIAIAHNGNITNAKQLKEELKSSGISFQATSDSEVLAKLLAYHISSSQSVEEGIASAAKRLEGAFSLVITSGCGSLFAVRDYNGYRPLCIGKNQMGVAVCSESCALETCGFEHLRDIKPGEIVQIKDGKIVSENVYFTKNKEKKGGLCIFEYVYFARPDSVIDGQSVCEARNNMGQILAKEYPVEADIVCGVPDSGLDAAEGYSAYSGIPLVSGFVKNRYIGRSFIYPTQSQRENAVKPKLNPIGIRIKGKRVVLVDDSIVRGTTSARIVKALKDAGALEVHMRISSPPFRHTCYYGTDIDDEENLIANKISVPEIAKKLGADSLGFISIEGLKDSCKKCTLEFCTACFTGYSKSVARITKGSLEGEDI